MKKTVAVESASAFIDEKIKELSCGGDWRGKMLAKCAESYTRPTLRSSKS